MNTEDKHDTFYGFDAIISMVARERVRQDTKFGEQNHMNEVWLTILMEEIGEISKEVLNINIVNSEFIDTHIENLDTEMIQAIAVLIAWYQSRKREIYIKPLEQNHLKTT